MIIQKNNNFILFQTQMHVKKQVTEPLTARLQLHDTHSNILRYGTQNMKKVNNNKKFMYDDCMNSISPWGVDQFTSQKNKEPKLKSRPKSKIKTQRIDNIISKQKQLHFHSKPIMIDIDDPKYKQQMKRKRSKTQLFKNDGLFNQTKLFINTIEICQNFQSSENKNQKYFSQDHKQRKMSMNKFRQTLLQTSRSKGLNAYSNKKIQQKKTFYQINPLPSNTEQKLFQPSNQRFKTMQTQNDNPLMFFFEVKNSKNMMQREKNIMKIRKLMQGKAKRINTDGQS